MNLLIFFAIPVATIILSAIFETFINCPIKVAGIAFSIFLIVAFSLGGTAELIIAAIVYTIISLITAFIVMLIQNRNCIINRLCNNCNDNDECSNNNCNCNSNNSCNCNNNNSNSNNCSCNRNNNSSCGCRNR